MSRESSETRIRILQATVSTLAQRGGRGVRMGDIARAAGISRQALYLHFASRTELLVAATRHLDQVLDLDGRLAASRAATCGAERLALYVEFWGRYVPEVYAVAKALLLAKDSDEAAAAAWKDRMLALRDGCRMAIEALHAEGRLASGWTPQSATDALWTLLLVPGWENLTIDCGWSVEQYIRSTRLLAERAFVAGAGGADGAG